MAHLVALDGGPNVGDRQLSWDHAVSFHVDSAYNLPDRGRALQHMQEGRRYANPPIVDAVIDLHVSFADPPTMDAVENLAKSLSASFPTRAPMQSVQIGIQSTADASINRTQTGFRLVSGDERRTLVLQTTSFTFGLRAPYSSWSEFSDEARSLWSLFVRSLNPARVTRHAIRFVNRISIPGNSVDSDSYFALRPEVPDSFQEPISGMFMQIQTSVTSAGSDVMAIVNLGLTEATKLNTIAFALDIDIFGTDPLDVEGDYLWAKMEKLRRAKNDIFESSITDATRALFV